MLLEDHRGFKEQRDLAGVMATLQRSIQHPRMCLIICVSIILLLVLFSQEIPAEHIDPAAIDLTPLVNTLINSSQSGSRQLFSLLSVTSYSSLALHKLTLLVYNISSIRSIESNMFRRRFCYCVTNETNDLTVSQRNNSDCTYICVMAGKMGRELSELWEVGSITPLFNQTIVEGPHTGNVSSVRLPHGEMAPTAHECESHLSIWDELHVEQQSSVNRTCFTDSCGRSCCNDSNDHRRTAAGNSSTDYKRHATESNYSRKTDDTGCRKTNNSSTTNHNLNTNCHHCVCFICCSSGRSYYDQICNILTSVEPDPTHSPSNQAVTCRPHSGTYGG
ncbi:hypothetical protein PAMA_004637 [Pampus argenteus]